MQLMDYDQLCSETGGFGFNPTDSNILRNADVNSNFRAGVYHDYISGNNLLTFKGTDPTSIADWYNNIKQGLMPPADQYDEAMGIAFDLRETWNGPTGPVYTPTNPINWLITGHSLGGGLAAAASMVSGFDAITFNAAGVNLNTLNQFYRRDLTTVGQMQNEARGKITSYVVDWDILTAAQDGISWLGWLGCPTLPTSLGTRTTLVSGLSVDIGLGTILVGLGVVIPGGEGLSVAGATSILLTMIEAHSYYVESLLLWYEFPLK
jgi:hypothetical protein